MTIITGDCLEVMRGMKPNSISAIVTDPPYGLSFMNKGWDCAVPGKEYWTECLRVTKPGGFLLAMGGTRTFHRLASAIEDAGYEIRDTLAWIYGSGFPKSHNHFGIDGYGTALKPAYEPIIMAMKKCDGTFKQNAEKWGQAGINVDGCRIEGEVDSFVDHRAVKTNDVYGKYNPSNYDGSKGRWPANVIFDEEAAALLDEQTGTLKSGQPGSRKKICDSIYELGLRNLTKESGFGDSGGASRFFYCAKASSSERNAGLEGLASKECHRFGKGLGEGKDPDAPAIDKNNHPTVKPLKLMEYLIKLIMPPKDGLLLDPFAGSGTTIVAAHRLGMKAIGIEKQPEYAEIARARVKAAEDLLTN